MRSKELWLVQENHATVKPDSSVTPRGMKTYSESRIELRNVQILKKMVANSSQFLSSEQPCEPKSFDVALNIAGVEKHPRKTCGCGQPRGHLIEFDSSLNEKSVSDGGSFCLQPRSQGLFPELGAGRPPPSPQAREKALGTRLFCLVGGDSQISLIKCWRHFVKRTGTFASKSNWRFCVYFNWF